MATIKDSTLYGKYYLAVQSNEADFLWTKGILLKFWKGEPPSLYGNAIYWHQTHPKIEGLGERIKESKALTEDEKDFLSHQDFRLTAFLTCDLPTPYKAKVTVHGADDKVDFQVEACQPLPRTLGIDRRIRRREDFWTDVPTAPIQTEDNMTRQIGVFHGSDLLKEEAREVLELDTEEEMEMDR